MNYLDKVIGYVWPDTGVRRAKARALLGAVSRAFNGAQRGSRGSGWKAGSGNANAELGDSLTILRNRSRDLVRNNGYIKWAIKVLVSNIVGTGIVPKFSDPKAAALWKRWSRVKCDAAGRLNFAGIQAQIARAIWESGEILVRLRTRRLDDGFEVPFQLQVLEADHLDSSKTFQFDGGFCITGVQFDALGQRTGYWLFDQHPGEVGGIAKSLVSRLVPATDVLHIFDSTGRPGQVRGFPELAVSIWKARDVDMYQEAELIRKKIEACFAVFVTSSDNQFSLGQAKESQQGAGKHRVEAISPGMIEYLQPGEEVNFASPSSNEGHESVLRVDLRAIAMGTGVTYEQLTGDYSQVNFTSGRMGKMEHKGVIEQFQWLTFIPQVNEPIADRFSLIAFLSGKLASPYIAPDDWTAPRIPLLDPLREGQGYKILMESRVMSRREVIRQLGYDPDLVDAEIAEDKLLPPVTPEQTKRSEEQTYRLLNETI